MIIRDYRKADAAEVGLLIKDTYSKFNLDFVDQEDLPDFLGPFAFAGDEDPAHQAAIEHLIHSQFVFLAEVEGKIAGVLWGRMDRLGSLFVDPDFHHQGIGRRLVERFEREVCDKNGNVIRVASSLYAVPFYLKMGYKKSTGIRKSWSFQGYGFPIQPMRKVL
jgi:GNAT superfamily N-acetyltransferase